MFERFTNRAQEVIGEAKKAAAQLEQNYIGTEHLLLGLVRVSAQSKLLSIEIKICSVPTRLE